MFNQRTDPRFQKIRELVADGTLGNLPRVNWTITDWFRTEAYYASSNWRATWAGEGGGVLLNQATHNLDLWQWMFGMPIRVRAVCGFGRHHHIEVEDDVTALFEYQNGATGVFVTSTGEAPGTNRLEIAGDRGRLVCEQDVLRFTQNLESAAKFSRQSEKHYEIPPRIDREWRFPDHGGQHRAILENFVDAILDGTPLLSPAKEGLNAVELANAMLWSSSLDKPVPLPLDETGYRSFLQQLVRNSNLRSVSSLPKTVLETAPYL
jgi:predicted dehydrogenase